MVDACQIHIGGPKPSEAPCVLPVLIIIVFCFVKEELREEKNRNSALSCKRNHGLRFRQHM